MTQKDKCPENAPACCAAYLRILGGTEYGQALVEYIVYRVKITRRISMSAETRGIIWSLLSGAK